MRVRTDVLLVVMLLAVLGLGVVLFRLGVQPSGQPQDTRTSTLLAGADGSQGVYEALAQLGVAVRRRRTSLFSFADEASPTAALAVVAPPGQLLSDELAEVTRYVRRGGVVIAAGEGGGITSCVGFEAPRADSGWVTDGAFGGAGRQFTVRPVAGLDLAPVRRVLTPWVPLKEFAKAARRYHQRGGCDSLTAIAHDTLLTTSDGRAVVVSLRFSAPEGGPPGRVLLVAEPGYFRNRVWKETSVPYFLVPLLVPQRRGALVWDEYHQGFEQGSAAKAVLWGWIKSTPVGWALLQIAAVIVVWLAVTAVRFGPALAVVERRRRSPLEHVEALAAGLEGAGGADTAVDLVVSGLRRRLSRSGQLAAGDVGPWLSALELALPSARGRAAARSLQRLRKEPGGGERVLAAAQAVEDVWQDLRPRSTSPAS